MGPRPPGLDEVVYYLMRTIRTLIKAAVGGTGLNFFAGNARLY